VPGCITQEQQRQHAWGARYGRVRRRRARGGSHTKSDDTRLTVSPPVPTSRSDCTMREGILFDPGVGRSIALDSSTIAREGWFMSITVTLIGLFSSVLLNIGRPRPLRRPRGSPGRRKSVGSRSPSRSGPTRCRTGIAPARVQAPIPARARLAIVGDLDCGKDRTARVSAVCRRAGFG
jgi:hypothetical protein